MIDVNSVAVVIAGGRSSRMGRDKALLPFGAFSTLAEFQYSRLSRIFSKVYISAKSNKFSFNVEVIEDRYEASSPLVALISIFETLNESTIFVLSVDAPFVNEETIGRLYARLNSVSDVIVAKSNNGLEPLCAIYRRTFLEKAKNFLEEERHKLKSLFSELIVDEVEIDEACFMNLNYPAEYEEALRE